MKRQRPLRKLTVNLDSIRLLDPPRLDDVQGAGLPPSVMICPTRLPNTRCCTATC